MVDLTAIDAARRILGVAREALGRGETKSAHGLMDEADRLLEAAWPTPLAWALSSRDRRW